MDNKYKYFKYPKSIEKEIYLLKNNNPTFWEKKGKDKVVSLANYARKNVVAYSKYLKEKGVDAGKSVNYKSFNKLPLTSKEEFLKRFNYIELFPKHSIDKITTISSTSGSTGEPFYFPRGEEQDAQYEYIAELFLKIQFDLDKKRTLAINGFGLGIWIGGIFTYKNFNKISAKGYRMAVAPTGTNKEIFLKTFKKVADLFDQIILMGYPPFIKDVVDEAENYDIDWKKYNLKVLTATEGYSEKFREYLIKKLSIKNRYKDILNIYGSVELGTMSHETPISNLIRKISLDKPEIFKMLFPHADEVPTLAQYYPNIVFFEEINGEVVASGYGSSFPLIRYRFRDRGGVIPFKDMVNKLKKLGIDIIKLAKQENISNTVFKLPFVYVYGRSDFVVIVRGANIYPENIRSGLIDDLLEDFVTGKFCMRKAENKKFEEYLEINIELKRNVKADVKLKDRITEILLNSLKNKNSEFNYLFNTEGVKLTPKVILYKYEHPKYFSQGIKQTWIKK